MDCNDKILGFFGEYRFLSNFYESEVIIDGFVFPTVEHYYQAYKAVHDEDFERIINAPTPGEAKKIGQTIEIRKDWNEVKYLTMYVGILTKFKQNPYLMEKLKNTGDAYLEETNTWGDTYWGVCNGKGQNKLGEILMLIRDEDKGVEGILTGD